MSREYHRVELQLQPCSGPEARPGTIEVVLSEGSHTGCEVGVAYLAPDMRLRDEDAESPTVQEAIDLLHSDGGLGRDDGLALGQLLHDRLLVHVDEPVARRWREIRGDMKYTGRALRMTVVLPVGRAGLDLALADLPLELLAEGEKKGGKRFVIRPRFIFQRPGNVLVRTFHGLKRDTPSIAGRIAVAWANPAVLDDRGEWTSLPGEIVADHERIVLDAASKIRLEAIPPCPRATRQALKKHLASHAPVSMLSMVAHGGTRGGSVLLHEDRDGQAAFGGEFVPADQFAAIVRAGAVKVALLWSCHGARYESTEGSVVEALLRPDQGDVPVVIASHVSLRAAATVTMARVFFDALAGVSRGDLEHGLSECWRSALNQRDLHWAAPVYHARPEQVHRVALVEAMNEADERAAQQRGGGRSLLPELTQHFVGRERDVARGAAFLDESQLVTVHGMPGIGKTALCLAIARRCLGAGRFDKGVWYALDGMNSVHDLAARLAADAGVKELDPDNPAHSIARAIGGEATWLVVLDNAEDLIGADRHGLREFARVLLRECPGVRVLLSSREKLGDLDGGLREAGFSLGRLESPHDRELFLAEAGERLAPGERDSDAVQGLLAVLDGHPLTIVLVASQVGLLSLAAIRRRLERDAGSAVVAAELIGAALADDAAARLRAKHLYSSIALSYEPLAAKYPAAAEMFAWLGVLPAGLPAALVPAVFCDEAEVNQVVLLRHSLVEQRGPDRRLGMPAPLRWFATSKLAAIEDSRQRELLRATVAAVGGWMQVIYDQARTVALGGAFERAWVELANLVVLTGWIAREKDEEMANVWARVGVRWSAVMRNAGSPSAALPLLESIHRLQSPGSRGQADTLQALGDLQVWTDRLKEGEESYGEALEIYREIEDRLGEANTLKALGDLQVRTSRLKEAEESYGEALGLHREIEDRLGEASTLRALGELQVRTDRLKEGEESYGEALGLYREIEDRLGEANTLKALGELQVRTDRLKEGEESYGEALGIYREIEHRLGEANTLAGLGNLSLAREMPMPAFTLYREALSIHQAIENSLGIAAAHGYMARAAMAAGALQRAVVLSARALEILRDVHDRFGSRLALDDLAHALDGVEQPEGVVGAVILAWKLAHELGEPEAATRGAHLAQGIEGLDPSSGPPDELVALAEEWLANAVAACQEAHDARGEGLLDPLPGPDPGSE